MNQKLSRNFTCRKIDGNTGKSVEQEETLSDEVETVMEFTFLGDRMSAGGGWEAAVIARITCWWVKLRECRELLYGRRFPLKLKGLFMRAM